MRYRVLSHEDYGRLVDTNLAPFLDAFPEDTDVVVVEDEAGVIVGCVSMFHRDHVEGLWIAEGHRNEPGVFWTLVQGIRATARQRGTARLVAGTTTDRMAACLRTLHATPLPGTLWVWPMDREES